MRRIASLVALVGISLASSGCVSSMEQLRPRGALFRYTTEPLTTNFHRTPVAPHRDARGDVKQIVIRNVRLRWDDNAIGQVAREAGMAEIWYADYQYFTVLGVWTQERVNLYGRYADEPEAK